MDTPPKRPARPAAPDDDAALRKLAQDMAKHSPCLVAILVATAPAKGKGRPVIHGLN